MTPQRRKDDDPQFPHRRRTDKDMPEDFGWQARLIGAVLFGLGVVGYVGDWIPYESKRHAQEQIDWNQREHAMFRDTQNSQAELLDELLRNQVRVMEKIGMTPIWRPRGSR